jgi:DNA-directed RNA polymerase specialized sigma subunit
VADNRKENELALFQKWKKSQDPAHFQELYGSMKNLIYDAARKASFGSNLPESAHRIYAAQNFLEALKTYNPNSGAALQTHVYGSVHQKAKRLNYLYQNLGSIPEPRAQMIGLYQNEHSNLHDELGREPSAAELADRMGVGLSQITTIRKELRKDLALGEGTDEVVFAEGSRDEELLHNLYFDLAPEEKNVYEYMFGKFGKPRLVKKNNKLDFDKVAKNMGVSSSKVRTIYGSIRKKLEKAIR